MKWDKEQVKEESEKQTYSGTRRAMNDKINKVQTAVIKVIKWQVKKDLNT